MIFKRALVKAASFYVTFVTAFFLTGFFTPDPPRRVVRQARLPRFIEQRAPRPFSVADDMSADAEFVTLDRASGRSYARLHLVLYATRPAPRRLWVQTHFFQPDDPERRVWTSPRVEIQSPFMQSNDTRLTVAVPCGLCDDEAAPPDGYFARVQLFAEDSETPLPPREQFFDVRTAMPVVVGARN